MGPLATPSAETDPAEQVIGASPAVRLFVERVQVVVSDFAFADGNPATFASICRRLDGIPLAVEPAATRVPVLLPKPAESTGAPMPALTGGASDLPERQQMPHAPSPLLRVARAPEQVLFCRLAVFGGGWTLQAAEVVCARPDLLAEEVLQGLTGFG